MEKPKITAPPRTSVWNLSRIFWILALIVVGIFVIYGFLGKNYLQLYNTQDYPRKEVRITLDSRGLEQTAVTLLSLNNVVSHFDIQEFNRSEANKKFWAQNWEFPVSKDQREPEDYDALPENFWDGTSVSCVTDCVPEGTLAAWPLRPFKQPRPIIGGLNDSRPGSYHHGVDITAGTREPVFAVQSGYAHIIEAEGLDARVQVGNYIYWHIYPGVEEGEYVEALKDPVGVVQPDFGHLHFSEVDSGDNYLNPLRPGQTVLPGWKDTLAPVLGDVELSSSGALSIRAYDRQSFVTRKPYITPPTGLAALAYRLVPSEESVDSTGDHELNFSLFGADNYPGRGLDEVYVTPGETKFDTTRCYVKGLHCPYSWNYWLDTGLVADEGEYRLIVYGWDWDGNVAARDYEISYGPGGWENLQQNI